MKSITEDHHKHKKGEEKKVMVWMGYLNTVYKKKKCRRKFFIEKNKEKKEIYLTGKNKKKDI